MLQDHLASPLRICLLVFMIAAIGCATSLGGGGRKGVIIPNPNYSLISERATESNLAITSIKKNEAAIFVSEDGRLKIKDSTIEKTFKNELFDEEKAPDYTTINAGVYASSGGNVNLIECEISTANSQGKGLFATGPESEITMHGGKISTTADYSYGVFAAFGADVFVEDATIFTKGPYSSVLATDPRSNGNIDVKGGTYITSGQMSAGICSNGKVVVTDANVRSNEHGVVMNGDGEVALKNVKLSAGKNGAMLANNEQYQVVPTANNYLSIDGGSIAAHRGDVFRVMHEHLVAHISVKGGTTLITGTGNIINVTDYGRLEFAANGENSKNGQEMVGNFICDETGSIAARLSNNASLKGAINPDNAGGSIALALDATSKWYVTNDSFLTTLSVACDISDGTIQNIYGNNHTVYYNSDKSSALSGKTYKLNGGGGLTPLEN